MKELLLPEDSAANGCRNVAEVSALNISVLSVLLILKQFARHAGTQMIFPVISCC